MLLELQSRLPARLLPWAPQALSAQLCYSVPAELMLAVVDRESLGGEYLKPRGPTGTGDRGRGHGLAQIDIGSHRSFLLARFDDQTYLWADPAFNILYGARLMAKNRRLSGSWPVAIAAYNAGLSRALEAAKPARLLDEKALVAAVDAVTTEGNYCSDVLRRWKSFGGVTWGPV